MKFLKNLQRHLVTTLRLRVNYAAPVWSSLLSDIHCQILQTAQNNVHRIATGSVKMMNVDLLHDQDEMTSNSVVIKF